MLDGMRRHKGWLKWSLALVCLTFVFLYVPGFVDQGPMAGLPNTVLARVGEHELTVMQFRKVYRQQLQAYRLQAGGEVTEDLLRQLGVDRQILQQLINELLQLTEAQRAGLQVTDAEIRQRIVTLPGFQENGRFIGEQRYLRLLQSQNPAVSPTEFEEEIRQQLLVGRLQATVTQWVNISDDEVEAEHRRRNEKVKVDVVAFRGDDFRDDVEASDEDIELLYEEESLVYQVPEKRRLRFLLLDEGALADSITPSDNEIQDYYDFNLSQYSTPGQVRASHILLRTEGLEEDVVEARAQELATAARDGADFAELAREHSDDEGTAELGGDLGLFGRGRMVPEFEGVAFSLDVDAISDPVKSPFGFHVIKVTEKQEETVQPLDEVRASIVTTLKREQASSRTTALSRSIATEVSTPAELDAAAAARGLEVQESGFAAPGEPILGLGLAQEVSARAFQIEEGVVEGPIASPLGPAFVTVVGRQDPFIPPLDDVRAQVREDVIRRKALTLARERAAEAATRLQGTEDFVAAAREADLTVGSSELMSRGGAFPEVGVSDAVEALAFALPVGGVSDVVEAGRTAAIVHVVERQDVTAAEFESAREQLRAELLQQKQDQFFQSYMNTAQETIELSIDQLALDEALGTT